MQDRKRYYKTVWACNRTGFEKETIEKSLADWQKTVESRWKTLTEEETQRQLWQKQCQEREEEREILSRELAEEMKEQIRAGGLREKAAAFYESITASTHFDTASQAKAREAEAGRVKEEAQACLLQIEKNCEITSFPERYCHRLAKASGGSDSSAGGTVAGKRTGLGTEPVKMAVA